jgi:Asp-tRNA(Asn)/Glu-tRNA(Gln) amidotransferase A subunit family amidase
VNLDDATNSAAADDTDTSTVADDTGVDTEGQTADNEPELDDDGNPIDPPEESEEIEHDGKKYAVPKALKPLLLMQADYTKKTQEVAQQREALAAERTALHQSSQAELDTYAAAKSMEAQLAQYERVDWDAWHEQDPFSASAATSKYQVLQRQYNQAMGHLSNLRTQRQSIAQQETARRIEEGRVVLAREVPGWNDELKTS